MGGEEGWAGTTGLEGGTRGEEKGGGGGGFMGLVGFCRTEVR